LTQGPPTKPLPVCRRFPNCRFISAEWKGFGETKALAVEEASHDWILSMDADEELCIGLEEEIREVLEKPRLFGYRIRRRSFYLGGEIRHCGWNRDAPLRLFQRRRGGFNTARVHESVSIEGEAGMLRGRMLHYSYPSLDSHILKMSRYSALTAEVLHERGRKSSPPGAVFRGLARFIRMYLLQLGFLDGRRGLILCVNSAAGVFWKYVRLWQLNRRQ
jgi:hypothetical protein